MRVRRELYAVDGWGVGEIVLADGVVLAHELPGQVRGGQPASEVAPRLRADAVRTAPLPPGEDVAALVAERVRRHLAGVETDYRDVPLDLSWCTPFQRELVAALRDVPWGEVVSYGELAALAGRPGAARAAGTFCARNRFALLLPCHRVVSADGIGGYGTSGVALKRRLLALEAVRL